MSSEEDLRVAETMWQRYGALLPHAVDQLATLHVIHADPLPPTDKRGWRRAEGWRMEWEGTVLKEWTNFVENLHGGHSAWLIDNCTTAALVRLQTPTFWGPPMTAGVSVNLEMSYLHPAPVGKKIKVTSEVLRISETLALLRGEIVDAETGKVLVLGNHLKAWKPNGPKARM